MKLTPSRELQNTTEYLLSYVDFQNTNFVVVILDSLFKTGKSGTQWYCVIPGTFSVPYPKCQFYQINQIKSDFNQVFETACGTHCLICIGMTDENGEKAALKMLFQLITGTR